MKEKLYNFLPLLFQNLMVSIYNLKAYKIRYGGQYRKFRKDIKENRNLSLPELKAYQAMRYSNFIGYAIKHSQYYREKLKNIDNVADIDNISKLPILKKEDLRLHLNRIISVIPQKFEKAKTGGTTGKSLEVYYTFNNSQERFAFLNDFRSQYGYELGKKTAWFSGKKLLGQRDIKTNRFWKTDYLYHVRYYSTFHIKEDYLKYYVENLIKYQPEYFVGFPSSILEIAKYGLKHNYDFPAGVVTAVFPTAESVTDEMRKPIEKFFKTKVYDQYASSEGAPFIFECEKGNLHLELQSGVFEVLDDNNQPTDSGRLVVTSFTTAGTPLIRYDIGDNIVLEDESKTCGCGNANPMVKEIIGRIDDFVFSPENGKINLGNVSNTLKDTKGIIRFQVIQNQPDEIDILVMKDDQEYTAEVEKKFIKNWRERVGDKMKINLKFVEDIPVEKSGKYRMVKNKVRG